MQRILSTNSVSFRFCVEKYILLMKLKEDVKLLFLIKILVTRDWNHLHEWSCLKSVEDNIVKQMNYVLLFLQPNWSRNKISNKTKMVIYFFALVYKLNNSVYAGPDVIQLFVMPIWAEHDFVLQIKVTSIANSFLLNISTNKYFYDMRKR